MVLRRPGNNQLFGLPLAPHRDAAIADTGGGGGGDLPAPPSGFAYIINADGSYLLNADGAYILGKV